MQTTKKTLVSMFATQSRFWGFLIWRPTQWDRRCLHFWMCFWISVSMIWATLMDFQTFMFNWLCYLILPIVFKHIGHFHMADWGGDVQASRTWPTPYISGIPCYSPLNSNSMTVSRSRVLCLGRLRGGGGYCWLRYCRLELLDGELFI